MLRFKKTVRPEAKLAAKKLAKEYNIDDPAGEHLLLTFCDACTLELDCMDQISEDGLTLLDRFQQKKAHPLLATCRDARSQKMAALKALNVDLEPLHDKPGRPPGR